MIKAENRFNQLAEAVEKLPEDRKQLLTEMLENNQSIEDLIEKDPELRTFTLEEIAKAYGISTRSLLRYIADGKLKATRFGRQYRVTLSALREFFKA